MPKYLYNKDDKDNIERIIAATFITDKIGYSYTLNRIILEKKGYDVYLSSLT